MYNSLYITSTLHCLFGCLYSVWLQYGMAGVDNIRHINGVHLSAVLKNIPLVQGIRCEPLGEHPIPWTCAVFFHTARK